MQEKGEKGRKGEEKREIKRKGERENCRKERESYPTLNPQRKMI